MKRKKIKCKELHLSIGKKQSMFHCEIKRKHVFWYEAVSRSGVTSTKCRTYRWYDFFSPSFLWKLIAGIFKILF